MNHNTTKAFYPPSPGLPPEMAFYFDYVTTLNSSGAVVFAGFNVNHGTVNFGHGTAEAVRRDGVRARPQVDQLEFTNTPGFDRGSARRQAMLSTFDRTYASPLSDPVIDSDSTTFSTMSAYSDPIPNSMVVPGSDSVTGPGILPSGSPGKISYRRVSAKLGYPGPGEYSIDYDTGMIYFNSDPGVALPEIPDPTNSGNPVMPISVDYRIQFNAKYRRYQGRLHYKEHDSRSSGDEDVRSRSE